MHTAEGIRFRCKDLLLCVCDLLLCFCHLLSRFHYLSCLFLLVDLGLTSYANLVEFDVTRNIDYAP